MPHNIPRNGDAGWNALAHTVERIDEKLDDVSERVVRVETKLDTRPCAVHAQKIDNLSTKLASSFGMRTVLAQWAVAITAIGALLWKVLG